MWLSRIPQRVASALAPVSSCFRRCPQAQHSRLFCWLLVALLLAPGSATLKQLTRTLPRRLHYWTVLRRMRAGYGSAAELMEMLAGVVLALRPPPPDGTLYLMADTTLMGRTGKKQPLAHDTRLNEFERFTVAHTLLLIVAHWGRLRLPVGAVVLDPKRKGQQNLQRRPFLPAFQPPAGCRSVIVLADAGFASKANLRVIQDRGWHYVVCLPRSWKLADATHGRDRARHLPQSRYRRVASSTPDQRRRDDWVFVRGAELKLLGDVTVLLSKKRRNSGPQQGKVLVTHLDNASATMRLSA
jgi:Transposase DDE domain